MLTEAQRRAIYNYRRKAAKSGELKQVNLQFLAKDAELYEFLQQQKPMATYIKDLIRKDMESRG